MIKITIYNAKTLETLEILEAPYPRFTKHYYDIVKRSVLFNLAFHADNILYVVEVNKEKAICGGAFNIDAENSFYWTGTPHHLNNSFCCNFYSKNFRRENLKK